MAGSGGPGGAEKGAQRFEFELRGPSAPARTLAVQFKHGRGRILGLELLESGSQPPAEAVTIVEDPPGSNFFRLTWPRPRAWPGPALAVDYVGERPALLRERWSAAAEAADLADGALLGGQVLAARLQQFKGLARADDVDKGAIEGLLRAYGAWPGRGRVLRPARTERGFEVLDAWRPGVDPRLLDPALEPAAPPSGPADGGSWHVPVAEALRGLGLSEQEIAAGHSMLLDVLTHDIGDLRPQLGLGPMPAPARDLEQVLSRLEVRVIDRVRAAAGFAPSGFARSLEGLESGVGYFSTLQRDLDQWYFGPLADDRALGEYERALAEFATGRLRLVLQVEGVPDASNTEPDSAYFFFFAEFAAAAAALASERDHWLSALPIQVALQPAYSRTYAPRGTGAHGKLLFMNYSCFNYEAQPGLELGPLLERATALAGKPLVSLEADMSANCLAAFPDEVVADGPAVPVVAG